MMSEQQDKRDVQEREPQEQDVARREFLKRVGQVGGLSFLTVLGLDGLVQVVEETVKERQATGGLAHEVAERLGAWDVVSVAHASCDEGYTCGQEDTVNCNVNYAPPCSMENKFGCVIRDVVCGGFTCPAGILAFNCNNQEGKHQCPPLGFTCTSYDNDCYHCSEAPYDY